jgi:serine/threonine-protein kinase MRCK
VEYIPDEQLMIALAGKQRQMRLIPVKALDQPADTEWIKVADTKGCLLFATGVMRPTATTSTILSGSFCLCVAVKRQVTWIFFLLRIAQPLFPFGISRPPPC